MSGVLARIGELVSPSALDAMARRYVACAGRLAAIFGLLPSHEVALDRSGLSDRIVRLSGFSAYHGEA